MQELNKLKNELKQLNEILSLDLTNWDPRTKSGMQGKQAYAKVRIEDLKLELSNLITKSSSTLLLMRDYDNTGEVVESAKKNPDANILLDSLMLEKKLFRQLFEEKATVYTFNTQIVNHLNIMLSEIGIKIGAVSMNIVQANAKYYGTLTNREAMIARLEAVLYDTFGDELKKYFFASLISEEINKRIHRDSVNVVIVNVIPNMVRAFSSFTGNTQVLSNSSPAPKAKAIDRTPKKSEAPAVSSESGPVINQITAETTKPYTGKKRGRKTDAERAARLMQEATAMDGVNGSDDENVLTSN